MTMDLVNCCESSMPAELSSVLVCRVERLRLVAGAEYIAVIVVTGHLLGR